MSKVTYAAIRRHLGDAAAQQFSRTVWKDGIDIDVVDDGLQELVNECTASITAERDALQARLDARSAEQGGRQR